MNTKKNAEDLRVRLVDDLKERMDKAFAARKISQVEAVNALVHWFVLQDPMVQAMVLGQIPADDDLIATVLRRLKASHRKT